MTDRAAVVAFVLSLLGATYQTISFGLAYLIDNRYSYSYYFGVNGFLPVIATLVVFWAMSHLLDRPDSRGVVWPAIVLAIGAANLGNLIIAWSTPSSIFGPLVIQTVPADVILTLVPAPLLLIVGGIFGFVAVQHQRKISSLGIRPSN